MSKILSANCNASGVVTAEGFEIEDVELFGEGKADSSGALIVDGLKKVYLPKTVSDLVTTLDNLSKALEQLAAALQSIDNKPTGGAGSAVTPVAVSQIAQLNSIKAEVDQLKGALK